MLGELEGERQIIICDCEAGVGTLARMEPGQVDAVVVVAEPTAKSIEVARRGAAIAKGRGTRVVAVANRVRDEDDVERIRAVLDVDELVIVPEEAAIATADRDGLAPMDVDIEAPGLQALHDLAERLVKDGQRPPALAGSA